MANPEPIPQLTTEQTRIIWLGAIAPAWSVISPISIDITRDNEEFVADSAQFRVHGVGATVQEAMADFMAVLQEYFELVQASAEAGDPFDLEELVHLESYISHSTA